MNKVIRFFFILIPIIFLLGIIITISMPRPKVSIFKKKELFKIIQDANKNLPHEIGTIATLNRISIIEKLKSTNFEIKKYFFLINKESESIKFTLFCFY